ncbi:calmodulin-binding transcription activator [Achlya hypogyna]|uniref:Calmodulin-binding transcription activator n=1 Tax=Achlya hypogyna TaxID=1202772 RepID=A0A1V9YXR6_ACHHY|nr:calmodulin-binding transcription activator [Achlya hypogyna]
MDATATEAARLAVAAKDRWLNKDEIAFLLLHAKGCVGVIPMYLSPAPQPPSGSLFFCNITMDYKKDGWSWQKKKGSETMVREDRAKLVVNRELVVLGAYAHSAETPTFHRRSYVLRVSEPRYMLVHYLDDVKSKMRSSPAPRMPEEDNNSLFLDDMALLDDMDLGVDNNMSDAYDDLVPLPDTKMPPPPSITVRTTAIKPLHVTDYSPNWDFAPGGAKLLICTSEELPSATQFFVQFDTATVAADSIAPTVLRCTAPAAPVPGPVRLSICMYVDGAIVALSETHPFEYKPAATTPAEAEDVLMDDVDTVDTKSTYSEPLSMKRARAAVDDWDAGSSYSAGSPPPCPPQPFALDHADLDDRQYKIRVVERLSEFRRAITSWPSRQPADACETVGTGARPAAVEAPESVLLDDLAVAALSDSELGALSDGLIEDLVTQLVAVAGTSADLLEELNSLDDAGLSLLHYVSFYNCGRLVPLLLAHGALVDQRSAQGQTALHLAAGCGHLEVIDVLLAHRADVTMFDFDCLTPADRAENSGHVAVAAYLRGLAEASPPKAAANLSFTEMRALGLFPDPDSSDQHNRKLLLGAFSTMSLHDKCALSLGTKRRGNSLADLDDRDSEHDMEVSSVMDDSDVGKLEAAMQLMGPDELALLEEEARVIQSNVRAWLLRRSYRHMRETTQKLQEAAKESLAEQKLERAAVTVQAATRSMLVRKSYLQQRNTAIKVQAAARGILCRKNFANMKKSALASLVIQKNVREWLAKPETS